MRIDRLERDDFEEDNHILLVEHDEDDVEFIITISDDRNCDNTQDLGRGREDDGFCTNTNSDSKSDDEDEEIVGMV